MRPAWLPQLLCRSSQSADLVSPCHQYGEDAIKENGMGGGGGMADIFDIFGGGGSRRRQEPKGDDIVHKLQVKLEDLYKGATR